jgi:hypothetical protein
MIVAEIVLQTDGDISINTVDTLSTIVNSVIDTAVDTIMVSGLLRLFVHSDHPKITGNTGKIQGARILNIHATNESTAREDIEYL